MSKNLWDHLEQVKEKKEDNYWENLSKGDKKSWSSYMITRALSMNMKLCPMLSEFQHLVSEMPDEVAYKFYEGVIPQDDRFYKYISKNDEGPPEWMIENLKEFYTCSEDEAREYYEILLDGNSERLYEIMDMFPLEEKEVNELKEITNING